MTLLKEEGLIAVNDTVNSSVRDNSNETKLSQSSKRRSFIKKCIVIGIICACIIGSKLSIFDDCFIKASNLRSLKAAEEKFKLFSELEHILVQHSKETQEEMIRNALVEASREANADSNKRAWYVICGVIGCYLLYIMFKYVL